MFNIDIDVVTPRIIPVCLSVPKLRHAFGVSELSLPIDSSEIRQIKVGRKTLPPPFLLETTLSLKPFQTTKHIQHSVNDTT